MSTTPPPSRDPAGSLRELVRSGRFAEALQLFRETGSPAARADERLLAATAATRLGELSEARSLAEEAARAFRARGDRSGSSRDDWMMPELPFIRR
jgi:hypothetical protein